MELRSEEELQVMYRYSGAEPVFSVCSTAVSLRKPGHTQHLWLRSKSKAECKIQWEKRIAQ